ncbi:hypothetical protein [Thaumasiovibrio sp. DFM-14]|uniref:hypothetical protein n=1 Tax=Thaumasiovibrio sp. DFM-14 TaxID=3384792 RepID=UPI0039A27965
MITILFYSIFMAFLWVTQVLFSESVLRRTPFFEFRYREQCEATLRKVMFLGILPIVLIPIMLLVFIIWEGISLFECLFFGIFSFITSYASIYTARISNRFYNYYLYREGKLYIIANVKGEPSEDEIEATISGGNITSKLFIDK